jgi:predicted nucleotidyltransferase component of viral defense system
MATLIQILEQQLAMKGSGLSNPTQRILLKEVLQSQVLHFLYNHKNYRNLNFYGGSCLRVVYQLNRMSEDIDLDNGNQVSLDHLVEDIHNFFYSNLATDAITSSFQRSENQIFRITLKFPVLFALKITQHQNENLHLKIEISQHAQKAIIEKTPLVYYGKSFVPSHFSIETMMAGKIIACLQRSFVVGNTKTDFKARDFYDLLWLMQKNIQPFREKLIIDGNLPVSLSEVFGLLEEKINLIDPNDLYRDLSPLFEDQYFIESWCKNFKTNFLRFSQPYRQ